MLGFILNGLLFVLTLVVAACVAIVIAAAVKVIGKGGR